MSGEQARAADRDDPAERARRSPARAAVYALVATVVVLAPAWWVWSLAGDLGMPAPATSEGGDVVRVWRLLLTLATAVGALVLVLLGIAVVSGARRREASQSKGSVPLEIAYTAVPLLLVSVIFGASAWLGQRITDATGGDSIAIDTEGFRWGWRFTYPEGVEVVGSANLGEAVVVLPVDRTITFELWSSDVIHSFWVPSFSRKLDVVPGEDNALRVRTDTVGDYAGYCAELCGLDHARMNFRVRVVEQPVYEAWIAGGGGAPP